MNPKIGSIGISLEVDYVVWPDRCFGVGTDSVETTVYRAKASKRRLTVTQSEIVLPHEKVKAGPNVRGFSW